MIRARKQLGMSQTELARRAAERGLPFHQQTIQRIEQAERPRPVRLNEAVELTEILMMDDLLAAMTPSSKDQALETLETAIAGSDGKWASAADDLAHLMMKAEQEASDLWLERSSFVRLSASLGESVRAVQSSGHVRLAEGAASGWKELGQRLSVLVQWMLGLLEARDFQSVSGERGEHPEAP